MMNHAAIYNVCEASAQEPVLLAKFDARFPTGLFTQRSAKELGRGLCIA
jgi:hypothetical protein